MSRIGAAEARALTDLVRRVSRSEILPRFRTIGGADIGTKTADDDLVTVADTASEAALAAGILEILPDALIVGEEAVSADAGLLDGLGGAELAVVVDPIDGTWNYANGLAVFGVILAVVEGGETTFGLLYDPVGDDWISARRGEGAWYSGPSRPPMRLATGDPGVDPARLLGYVQVHLFPPAEQPGVAATLPHFRRTMSLRCSCHEYRMQVQGRASFCVTAMLNVWDHAAGVLCLQEAGGVARLLDGSEYRPTLRTGRLLTAASEPLWETLSEVYAAHAGP